MCCARSLNLTLITALTSAFSSLSPSASLSRLSLSLGCISTMQLRPPGGLARWSVGSLVGWLVVIGDVMMSWNHTNKSNKKR
ncbi:hypothetical protein BC939DRAFT_451292 [Gamsiella multidivaricata]|uniref:uncharacterized protein n=1 Tax=Gamsiella multidivaricata TaxID=101098 RepID=UPI0022209B16|nr:uncharacterized protein BC939DRAFT_451292 [Gamsiella multidivaricata]KAI7823532.1 hypothetical protein BC939DRAFT_451292 [Gamsiella multidivaricata]